MTTSISENSHRADVAVIGGGLAGLTAAVTAARAGATVTLIDAHSLGGRARSVERQGYTLNQGPHALYEHGGGRAVLDELGVRVAGSPPPVRGTSVVWDGEVVPLPATPSAIATTRLLGTRSKLKLTSWFANLDRQAMRCGDVSIAEWLADQRAGADLQRFVLTLLRLTTYAAEPEQAAAPAMLRQLAAGMRGVRYLDGGWQTIVDELQRIACDAGVTLVDHAPVLAVEPSAGGWSVHAAHQTVDSAAVVIAAGGPALAATLLGHDDAGWVERAGPRQRAACLDIGGAPTRCPILLSADEPLYLSTHAPVAQLAPRGHHLITVMRYLADGDATPAADHRAALERHAAAAGLPAAGDRVIDRFLAGLVVTWGSGRPGVVRPTGMELGGRGVFAAGDWVGERMLADAAIVSGRDAGVTAVAHVSQTRELLAR